MGVSEERLKRGMMLLKRLSEVRVVATDLDGTLTRDRGGFLVPVEVFSAIKLLRENGVKVIIVTANCFPVAVGFAKYAGASAVVAENGCMVTTIDDPLHCRPLSLSDLSAKTVAELVVRELEGRVARSWQNDFRKHDFALIIKSKDESPEKVVEQVCALVEEKGFSRNFTVSFSGYALHITPRGCSKLGGLRKVLEIMGERLENTLGIGDSEIDREFIKACGVSVAVSNADEALKEVADIITEKPSGYGFAELAEVIVEAKKLAFNKALDDKTRKDLLQNSP